MQPCVKKDVHAIFPHTMLLFKLPLLIPPSTSGVERGFSVMNLLVSPLRATLNERNLDRLMRICLNGPDKFSDNELEHLVDKFKDSVLQEELFCNIFDYGSITHSPWLFIHFLKST